MAEVASDTVTFDIFDGIILEGDQTILDNLKEDEQLEVTNVRSLLDSAKEDSMNDFETDANTTSDSNHKIVCNDELDRLASKNSALATTYQTKWAVAVIKAKYFSVILSK